MTTQLSPLPIQHFVDNNGNPLSGGQLSTFAAGTSTPQATYTDSTGSTPNTNPVVLNSRGEANVWLTPGQSYKLALKDASLNVIWTVDQISSFATTADLYSTTDATKGSALVGYLSGLAGGSGRTVSAKLQEFISVKDFGAKGDGTTDDSAAVQSAFNNAPLGACVYFPAGTYYAASALTLPYGVSIQAQSGAQLMGPTSGTSTMLSVSGVNNGLSKPFYTTDIRGLMFRCRAGYAALYIHNSTFATATFERGMTVADCYFTSYEYTTANNVAMVALELVNNVRFQNCSFTTYSVANLVGVNNGIELRGSANCTFTACNFTYTNVAVKFFNSGGQLTQGIRFIGCMGNGNLTTLSSVSTNDCQFVGCIFDNHTGQAVTSSNDLGLSFTDCYIGSSFTTGPIISIACTSGNANQLCKFSACVIAQYVASSSNAINVSGVSGTFYNNAIFSGCEFRNSQYFSNYLVFNFAANCIVTGCQFSGFPTGQPVGITNSPTGAISVRCTNTPGVSPWGNVVTGVYAAPTALVTVGTNVPFANPYPFDCMVYVYGGTLTGVQVVSGATGTQNLGTPGGCLVPAGAKITVSFTGSPTWAWFGV